MTLRRGNFSTRNVIKTAILFFVCIFLLLHLNACQLIQVSHPTPQVVFVQEEISLEEAMTLVAQATLEAGGAVKAELESTSTFPVQEMKQGEKETYAQTDMARAISIQATTAVQAAVDRLSTAQVLLSTQTQVIRQRNLQPVSTLAETLTAWPSPVATNPTTFFRNTFTPLPTKTFTPAPTETLTPTPIPPGLPGLTMDSVKAALVAKGLTRCKEETDGWVTMAVCEAQTSDNKNWYYAEIYSVPGLNINVNNVIMAVFQAEPNDEVTLEELRTVAGLNYENAEPAAALAWLEQNLPSLKDENDKRQARFGGVSFVLYGPKNGVRLELGAPPPYPTPSR